MNAQPIAGWWQGSRDKDSLVVMVLANLIPLGGVLFAGWEVGQLLMIYWAENLVIGFYNILKMITCTGAGLGMQGQLLGREINIDPKLAGKFSTGMNVLKVFLVPFFTVHYGIFCMVHGMFVLHFAGGSKGMEPWDLVHVIRQDLLLPVMVLGLSHGYSFVRNYLLGGEFRTASPPALMFAPYGRIVLLHVSLIFGGFAVMAMGSPMGILILLVLGKIAMDLVLHARSHKRAQQIASISRD